MYVNSKCLVYPSPFGNDESVFYVCETVSVLLIPIMGINFKETRQEVGRSLVKLSPCADRVAVRCYVYFEFTADKISGW